MHCMIGPFTILEQGVFSTLNNLLFCIAQVDCSFSDDEVGLLHCGLPVWRFVMQLRLNGMNGAERRNYRSPGRKKVKKQKRTASCSRFFNTFHMMQE